MFTASVARHGPGAPAFRFHSLVGQTAHVSSGLNACWVGHCQSQSCQAWSPDLPPHGVVTVVPPAVPIDVAMVVAQVASVEVEVDLEAVPSAGHSVIAHSGIAHSVIARQPTAPLQTAPRVVVLSRDVPPVVVLLVTDLLAIALSVIAQSLQAIVVLHSSLVTASPDRMRAEPLHVQRARNAGPNQPVRTSSDGFGPPSLV